MIKNSSLKNTAQADEIAAKRAFMLKQVSEDFPSKANHFIKAYRGSLRSAITAKCIECTSGDTKVIRECTAYACPLWEKRPYQTVRESKEIAEG